LCVVCIRLLFAFDRCSLYALVYGPKTKELEITIHSLPIMPDQASAAVVRKFIEGQKKVDALRLQIPPLPQQSPGSRMDVGLDSFAALSNGMEIDNPRHFKRGLAHLRRAQRGLSRRQRGSHRRRKGQKSHFGRV
jgi:transposase